MRLAFGNTITIVLQVDGQVRPGSEKGHEHFVSLLSHYSVPVILNFSGGRLRDSSIASPSPHSRSSTTAFRDKRL